MQHRWCYCPMQLIALWHHAGMKQQDEVDHLRVSAAHSFRGFTEVSLCFVRDARFTASGLRTCPHFRTAGDSCVPADSNTMSFSEYIEVRAQDACASCRSHPALSHSAWQDPKNKATVLSLVAGLMVRTVRVEVCCAAYLTLRRAVWDRVVALHRWGGHRCAAGRRRHEGRCRCGRGPAHTATAARWSFFCVATFQGTCGFPAWDALWRSSCARGSPRSCVCPADSCAPAGVPAGLTVSSGGS